MSETAAGFAEQAMLARGRQVLAAQPFSVLLGARLLAFGPAGAELEVPITETLRQQNGFAHGGVVSYLADNALTYAGGAALGTAVVTSEYKINYLRPALGERLVARANVLHGGRNQAVCRCDVFAVSADRGETLCAVAQGTIARLSEGRPQADREGSVEDGAPPMNSRSTR
ncbi:MAG TPA: PaaI family thioesterase [Zeimonas sp.]